jgi:hypothetical protein
MPGALTVLVVTNRRTTSAPPQIWNTVLAEEALRPRFRSNVEAVQFRSQCLKACTKQFSFIPILARSM